MNFFDAIGNSFRRPNVEMSNFDLSHEHKTTMQFGKLVPIMCEEVLPGDKWHISASAFVRTMPLLSPMMHKTDLKVRFFFVPNRLVWDNWERFVSDGRDEAGSELNVPTITLKARSEDVRDKWFGKGTLTDYFGFAMRGSYEGCVVSQLPYRAYDCIYREYFANQWFGDIPQQSYQGSRFYNKFGDDIDIDENDTHNKQFADLLLCEDVCWEKDYFTSCSPTPMAATGSVPGLSISNHSIKAGGHPTINDGLYPTAGSNNQTPTISELRQAYRLQAFLENSLKTGKRYVEQLMAHFGVDSSDKRLQRPEYLGGGKLAVQVSEVASTASAESGHLGDLAGRGLSVGSFADVNFTSEEHGYLFAIAYISPHSSYYGGIPRTFIRRDRWDFAFPEFADLGEQPVWRCELDSADNYHNDPTQTIFGYVPRYSEYKTITDRFSGDMVDTLNFWHLGRDFSGTNPALNEDFLYINDKARAKLNRVFGVTNENEHPFVCTFGFNIDALRPLPFNPQSVM